MRLRRITRPPRPPRSPEPRPFLAPALLGSLVAAAALTLPPPATAQGAADGAAGPSALERAVEGLEWRSIGPAEMGGRTTDVVGRPGDPSLLYFATASGGLWRSSDAGATWTSLFDDQGTLSIGDVAVAPSDPAVIWVGTGENNPRNSTSVGDGVYRTTDGGRTWTHRGLEDTERVGRIRVHPDDPDVAWVAAMGHLWGPNEQRGVFRTRDGGETWEKVLFVDEDTGAADLALHPENPRILYAAMWDYRRRPWHFRSGGPGSGLWRSTDGGDTWAELTGPGRGSGLPEGTLGRIGLAVSPDAPDRVYAIVESEHDGIVWRSDDRGDTWRAVSEHEGVGGRPFYYSDLRADPTDANTLYGLAGGLYKSIDAGRTWDRIAGNIHGDHHALWIDPLDPDRLLNGNDGGFHVSRDGGESWEHVNTVPLGQFYHVALDSRRPYRVCGGLQDNDVWCGPSRTLNVAGILQNYWYEIVGPGDGMHVQIDPRDPDVAYTDTQGGHAYRVDLSTGEARSIHPYPVPLSGTAAGTHEYRFNWDAPLLLSPHDPETLYLGGNVLFRTRDAGASWDVMSPDLSDADSSRLGPSGGLTPDNTTAEYHATITALSESPLREGLIWAGTDDGNLHVTRDGGETWTEVTGRLPGLPPDSWVSHVEASAHDAGAAYASFDRHRSDDMAPYVYRTTDGGESWTDVTGNLPAPGWVHVVREDPRNPDLVYAGTELGLWASWTRGGEWVSLRSGLPPVAVRDLKVHPRENDLVIGTHGRSVWVLDDAGPLQRLPAAVERGTHLFPPRPATRFEPAIRRFDFDLGDAVFVGENPPYGALLTYWLAEDLPPADADPETADVDGTAGTAGTVGGQAPVGEGDRAPARVRLHVLDAAGDTVRTLRGPGTAGLHRLAWDLRHGSPDDEDDEGADESEGGEEEDRFEMDLPDPRVLPGAYTAVLELPRPAGAETAADGGTRSDDLRAPLEVRLDPRLEVPAEALAAQHGALMRLRALGRRGVATVRALDAVEAQLQAWAERLEGPAPPTPGDPARAALADSARAIAADARELRATLAPPEDDEGGPGLLGKIRSLMGAVGEATFPPTEAQSRWAERHAEALEAAETAFRRLAEERLPRFDAAVGEAGLSAIEPR